MVTPILTHGPGRTGSTLLLELLQTSPQILVEGSYPYETRLLAGITGVALSAHGDPSAWQAYPGAEAIANGERLTRASSYAPTFSTSAAGWKAALKQDWEESVALIAERRPMTCYYAEKSFPFAAVALAEAGVEHRNLVRVRDPRDTWCSILAFDRQRGFHGFGRQPGENEEAYLGRYLQRMARFYDPRHYPEALWLRYEDLVSDAVTSRARLEDWLDVELSWSGTRAYRQHMTSESARASIGRWKTDLQPAHRELIEMEMRGFMERWGYL